MKQRTHSSAFSLVELSIVIIIVGLLVASALTGAEVYIERTRRDLTQDRLTDIQKALEEYVQNNGGTYPCPAPRDLVPGDAGFGWEADTAANCANTTTPLNGTVRSGNARIGAIPVRTLNLPTDYAADAWDNKFTYAITRQLITTATAAASLTVNDGNGNSVSNPAGQVAWVVVSHGKNRMGAFRLLGTTVGTACTGSTPEAANCSTSVTFNDALYNANVGSAGYYDDFIKWGMKSSTLYPSFYVTSTTHNGSAAGTACQSGYSVCGTLQWSGRVARTALPTSDIWVNSATNCTNWSTTAGNGTTINVTSFATGATINSTCATARPVMCCTNTN